MESFCVRRTKCAHHFNFSIGPASAYHDYVCRVGVDIFSLLVGIVLLWFGRRPRIRKVRVQRQQRIQRIARILPAEFATMSPHSQESTDRMASTCRSRVCTRLDRERRLRQNTRCCSTIAPYCGASAEIIERNYISNLRCCRCHRRRRLRGLLKRRDLSCACVIISYMLLGN